MALSDWITVTQQQVNLFARATGDHQRIRVDPDKARGGPFGTTPANGLLIFLLLPAFLASGLQVVQTRMKLLASEPIENGGRLMTW